MVDILRTIIDTVSGRRRRRKMKELAQQPGVRCQDCGHSMRDRGRTREGRVYWCPKCGAWFTLRWEEKPIGEGVTHIEPYMERSDPHERSSWERDLDGE